MVPGENKFREAPIHVEKFIGMRGVYLETDCAVPCQREDGQF